MRTAFLFAIFAVFPANNSSSNAFGDEPVAARKPTRADGRHAEDPLKSAIQVAAHATESLTSAIATGTFKRFEQKRTDKEPKLWTEAKVDVFFDRGKYHLHFDFQRMLHRTTYSDREGRVIEKKVVDWKPEDYVLIYDGMTAYSITFTERSHPTGCSGEIFSSVRNAASVEADFRWGDIARPWREMLNVETLVANLGREAIKVDERAEGIFRCSYQVKNSPKYKGEYHLDGNNGFQVVSSTLKRSDLDAPVQTKRLTWKNTDGVWHVASIFEEFDFRELRDDGLLTRSVFEYTSFKPNVKVDPKLFTLQAVEIPAGTRFIDRRRGAVHRFQYKNGPGLTPRRP